MTTFEELDRLSSRELHDRAMRRAKRHLDVRFFWELMEIAPAAQMVQGDPEETEADVLHWSSQVHDAFKQDSAVDGRRQFYIDYLLRHGG
jgi:hypothetical protein